MHVHVTVYVYTITDSALVARLCNIHQFASMVTLGHK